MTSSRSREGRSSPRGVPSTSSRTTATPPTRTHRSNHEHLSENRLRTEKRSGAHKDTSSGEGSPRRGRIVVVHDEKLAKRGAKEKAGRAHSDHVSGSATDGTGSGRKKKKGSEGKHGHHHDKGKADAHRQQHSSRSVGSEASHEAHGATAVVRKKPVRTEAHGDRHGDRHGGSGGHTKKHKQKEYEEVNTSPWEAVADLDEYLRKKDAIRSTYAGAGRPDLFALSVKNAEEEQARIDEELGKKRRKKKLSLGDYDPSKLPQGRMSTWTQPEAEAMGTTGPLFTTSAEPRAGATAAAAGDPGLIRRAMRSSSPAAGHAHHDPHAAYASTATSASSSERVDADGNPLPPPRLSELLYKDFDEHFNEDEFYHRHPGARRGAGAGAGEPKRKTIFDNMVEHYSGFAGADGAAKMTMAPSAEASLAAARIPTSSGNREAFAMGEIARRTHWEDIQYRLVPAWEDKLRLVVGRTVPFSVSWKSFERSANPDAAAETLLRTDGDYVFGRIVRGVELAIKEHNDAKILLGEGLLKVVVKNVGSRRAVSERRPERVFLESLRVDAAGGGGGAATEDGRPVDWLARGGRIPAGEPGMAARASGKPGVVAVSPENVQKDCFVLKVCAAFEDGIDACFSPEEICAAMRPSLWAKVRRPLDHAVQFVVPRWQDQMVQFLGKSIPIEFHERSFGNAHDPARAAATVELDNGNHVVGAIVAALKEIAEQYPDGKRAIQTRLARIQVKLRPGDRVDDIGAKVKPLAQTGMDKALKRREAAANEQRRAFIEPNRFREALTDRAMDLAEEEEKKRMVPRPKIDILFPERKEELFPQTERVAANRVRW